MKHFFSTKVRIVLIIAIVLAVALTMVGRFTDLRIGETLVQGVLTPLRAAASSLSRQAERLYSYMFRYESLEAENAALREQLAAMEDNARQADAYLRENERLRGLLELKQSHADYTLVDAYVIARSSQEWTDSFTINRGTDDGVEAGMCAITANGEVIGLVDEVAANYAVVRTILDSSLEISATIASSGYGGVVRGGYTMDQAGYLRMNYLPTSSVIRNQDQVVTAGSTVYPRNLILGYIVDAGFDETGVAKYAVVEPAASIGDLEQVFILTDYNAG